MPLCIGFVGFGEVASVLARRLQERGVTIWAYDRLLNDPQRRDALAGRAAAQGVRPAPLPEVLAEADYVLSTVTPQAAMDVAGECARHLQPGQVYVDLNSTSPAVKVRVGQVIEAGGGSFVEGAVLGAIGVSGADTRILVTGAKSLAVAEALTGLGLNVCHYPRAIGQASRFKMLRSIFSKGMEALLLELLLAAREAGLTDDLWEDITTLLAENPFERVAANWVRTHPGACERRYHELGQVLETLGEMGVEPVMTAATQKLFARSLALGLHEAFAEKPGTAAEVIDALAARLAENSGFDQ